MPVTSSTPNSTPMNSSGAAIHSVSPSDNGPPMAKPRNPAACWRAVGSCGEPAHRCHSPRAGSAIIAAPRISRGRASASGSVRMSTTATAASAIGTSTTAEPMSTRRKVSTHCADRVGRRRTTNWRRPPPRYPARPARCRRGGGPARGRGPGRPSARSNRRPWPASASLRGRRGPPSHPRRRYARGDGAAVASGGAPTAARDVLHSVSWPLTCSNGRRIGRRSY